MLNGVQTIGGVLALAAGDRVACIIGNTRKIAGADILQCPFGTRRGDALKHRADRTRARIIEINRRERIGLQKIGATQIRNFIVYRMRQVSVITSATRHRVGTARDRGR